MKVLFVCMGNICRSPTAEAVFRKCAEKVGMDDRVTVDSAGTGNWHVGKGPDSRACMAAARRGYDLTTLRARQVSMDDFQRFDLILAMDHDNLDRLLAMRPSASKAEIDLFLRRYGVSEDAVPDPYYGGEDGFEQVLDLIEDGAAQLLNEIRGRL
ncbi:low molecular weight protein-tyrosine-phosphatase [Stutzerimonas chloritidismutans]|uniref:protein-tyrosine-phosphatase n=1 Tax=Stutzerimonas chloritidismutans TaxID=203192 RepID=A0ABU9M7I2_STUCH